MSKKPDYLTLCSIAAQKAGTSYGKYMAMHGYHPPIQADVEDVEAPQGISKICPQCGKEFTQGKIKQKIYCSLECQKAHAQRGYGENRGKSPEATAYLPPYVLEICSFHYHSILSAGSGSGLTEFSVTLPFLIFITLSAMAHIA